MTQDQPFDEPAPEPFYDSEWVGFPIPGIQYATIHVNLGSSDEKARQAFETVLRWAEIHAAVFKGAAEDHGLTRATPAEWAAGPAPQQQQRPAPAQGAQTGNLPKMLCPKHPGAVLMPSVRNKNVDWDEATKQNIAASWFHKDEQGQSCSVWQSQAVRG